MSILRRIDHGTAMANAAVLAQALPWLKRFHGATAVVKYGGNAMVDNQLKRSFAADIVFLHTGGSPGLFAYTPEWPTPTC